ncbi:uncharacterized protein LOC129596493 [Paramacrobiotus metropolitanus]|uniref:uncharacterized protein LOC129596493 n=1 Tax=Paramacrobiotus metropolitanus TaxID=2943436 RepID=UPI002445AA0B|nr:uncharacterized protein LOC129596493 [Paramacrobiotus metropolitanus]
MDAGVTSPIKTGPELEQCSRIRISLAPVFETLQDFRRSGAFCDVVVLGYDSMRGYDCHSVVLSACSGYFRRKLFLGWRSSTRQEIRLETIAVRTLYDLIMYAYSEEIEINRHNVVPLLEAARVLEMDSVADACWDFLEKNMDVTNCLTVLRFPDQTSQTHAKTTTKAIAFAYQNFFELTRTNDFLHLDKKVLEKLLNSNELSVANENIVFEAVMRWVDNNTGERLAYRREILQFVRWPFLNQKNLSCYRSIRPLWYTGLKDECSLRELMRNLVIKSSQRRPRTSYEMKRVIVSIGGENRFRHPQLLNTVEFLHLTPDVSKSWSSSSFPYNISDAGVTVTEDNALFVCGGRSHYQSHCYRAVSHAYRYDPYHDPHSYHYGNGWIKVADLHTPRERFAMASIKNRIYAVGGRVTDTQDLKTVECYDPSTNTWRYVASLPIAMHSFALVACGGRLYTIGGAVWIGQRNLYVVRSVLCYDPDRDEWSEVGKMRLGRYGCSACVGPDGLIYVFGGEDTPFCVETFDARTYEWFQKDDMLQPHKNGGAFLVNDAICVMDPDSGLEVYNFDLHTWETKKAVIYGPPYTKGCAAVVLEIDNRNTPIRFPAVSTTNIPAFHTGAVPNCKSAAIMDADAICPVKAEYEPELRSRVRISSEPVFGSLRDFRRSGTFCDVIVRGYDSVRGYDGHSAVLSACSGYIRRKLLLGWKNSAQQEIRLGTVSKRTLYDLIMYAYGAEIEISRHNVITLLEAARLLEMDSAVDACWDFFDQNMDEMNCLTVLRFPDRTSQKHAKIVKKARMFADQHFCELSQKSDFLQLQKDLIMKLLSSDELIVPNENVVFDVVMRWLDHKTAERGAHQTEILQFVRWPFLSQKNLERYRSIKPLLETGLGVDCSLTEIMANRYIQNLQRQSRASYETKKVVVCIGGENYFRHPRILDTVAFLCPLDPDIHKAREHSTSFPYHVSDCGAVVTEDNSLFVCGGRSHHNSSCYCTTADVHRYDPFYKLGTGKRWVKVASMQTVRERFALAALDNRIYAVGGRVSDTQDLATVECYEPAANAWRYVASLPVAMHSFGLVACGDNLYAFGGALWKDREKVKGLCSVLCFDPERNEWREVGKMPERRYGCSACVGPDGLIYIIGGEDTPCRVETFNASTCEWIRLGDKPQPHKNGAAFLVNDKICVMDAVTGLQVYDFASDTWETKDTSYGSRYTSHKGCAAAVMEINDKRRPVVTAAFVSRKRSRSRS